MVARKPIFANKEDANAREALVLYEAKQYKKALKLVDQNLKKNSSHAESLALKGCSNYQLGHKADAESYIAKALKKDPSNYLVDHLAGIYYRNVENYAEAAKWYKAALDNGSQNTPILRDLALLQAQLRDFKGLRESRVKFLETQPGYRANWTAVAVAHHLNKDYDSAVTTLAKIEGIIKEHLQEQDRYEQSECVLYKNLIIAESGNFGRALQELEADVGEIRDRVSFLEYKAKYLLLLGKHKDASVVYRQLIQINPDNMSYYYLLETALLTPSESEELRLKLYDKLATFYPRSDPPQFIPLTFLPAAHPEFRSRVKAYIVSQLKRGVPATFVNVKPLYKNSKKIEVIASVLEDFAATEVPQLPPPVSVWTSYFLAQHHLYLGDLPAATRHIDAALVHSPTLVELYILKARIVKHTGDAQKASDIMQEGRGLDLQDRFINSKTTKYLMRANRVEEAIDCVSLFTKLEDGAINGLKDAHVMQANWVLIESAEAYYRLYQEKTKEVAALGGSPEEAARESEIASFYRGLALKRFLAVIKVFKVFVADQFDYHSYCMRRGTPRGYVDMLQWEDRIHSTPIYVRAVKGLMALYLDIVDEEPEADDEKSKKKKSKKGKPLNKKLNEWACKVESEKNDEDVFGQKALADLKDNNTIDAAMESYVKELTSEADQYKITWELAYGLYKRELKYVLTLQALRNWAKIVDPNNLKLRSVGEKVLDFKAALASDTTANPAIVKVAQKGIEGAFPQLSEGEDKFREVYSN
ncbi:N-terminal acetyltransferase A, auxiliary subunit [Metschnikowia bicuspidata var. bicuspidata NRRL YB-4993]|uniref:N-terminal acetyltransferase A, auxiliary subunit n=1 Tax=Metschnikowia bicuspidata var. bicuspidata NRRL YB-4993 TaxID=869754 RepID=A0A1A0HCY5_9ASCO|nr:N-terminal acetyltransferase A, auxiliary subunit [Metschnikowia bicuspidata var. bicuspidata NRRL YB-4993]OBA21835.1 N-terminal acetyltransferase A, auxiliary subunit [Metschnikowia bicuspidata var. bicuspidata NRRL YB-4993]